VVVLSSDEPVHEREQFEALRELVEALVGRESVLAVRTPKSVDLCWNNGPHPFAKLNLFWHLSRQRWERGSKIEVDVLVLMQIDRAVVRIQNAALQPVEQCV
jgi:hypothetical protein